MAATVIISILILAIIGGITIVFKIASSKLNPAHRQNSSSPAPVAGNSMSTPSASSGGSSSSGQKGKGIPNWIMPLGIVYLVIRGVFIYWLNYISLLDWIIILVLALLAIISFWNGKNRWLSLVLIVAIGCIIWFNQAHIDSLKQKTGNKNEQSTQQEQVATAPVEETISTERVVVSGRKITLTGDGTYIVPAGIKSLCFSHWGLKDGSINVPQQISINGEIFNTLGRKCFALKKNLSGKIVVDFFPHLDYGTPEKVKDIYNYWRSQPGGQAEWPVIRIGE